MNKLSCLFLSRLLIIYTIVVFGLFSCLNPAVSVASMLEKYDQNGLEKDFNINSQTINYKLNNKSFIPSDNKFVWLQTLDTYHYSNCASKFKCFFQHNLKFTSLIGQSVVNFFKTGELATNWQIKLMQLDEAYSNGIIGVQSYIKYKLRINKIINHELTTASNALFGLPKDADFLVNKIFGSDLSLLHKLKYGLGFSVKLILVSSLAGSLVIGIKYSHEFLPIIKNSFDFVGQCFSSALKGVGKLIKSFLSTPIIKKSSTGYKLDPLLKKVILETLDECGKENCLTVPDIAITFLCNFLPGRNTRDDLDNKLRDFYHQIFD